MLPPHRRPLPVAPTFRAAAVPTVLAGAGSYQHPDVHLCHRPRSRFGPPPAAPMSMATACFRPNANDPLQDAFHAVCPHRRLPTLMAADCSCRTRSQKGEVGNFGNWTLVNGAGCVFSSTTSLGLIRSSFSQVCYSFILDPPTLSQITNAWYRRWN
ncbi:uncharacterized protein LOC107304481 [Oryza brachyantha]|uniref:uncharacterized protein LOC107304481 n=1 Tax=Oryza brachyantha TaxID=4533 RepID=UPI001ADA1B08|nr:uncharacterized protein LOC107304481 [Oryza brachyantha]